MVMAARASPIATPKFALAEPALVPSLFFFFHFSPQIDIYFISSLCSYHWICLFR